MRDQENYSYLHQRLAGAGKVAKEGVATAKVGLQPAAPFQFNLRRIPIDWRLLHGIDVSNMVSSVMGTCFAMLRKCCSYSRPLAARCSHQNYKQAHLHMQLGHMHFAAVRPTSCDQAAGQP